MKYLQTYRDLNLHKNDVFPHFFDTLKESIRSWDYFVDFNKIKKNIRSIEPELNLLNVLIGKKYLLRELVNLATKYPRVREVLPMLLAIRISKLKEMDITHTLDTLESKNMKDLFNSKIPLTVKSERELLHFFEKSGLSIIFKDKDVKNLVDYCFGIEVGMDTNARKNRAGTIMENLVEAQIKELCSPEDFEYIAQATRSKIKKKWGLDIPTDKTNRKFDFAIYHLKKNQLFVVETNFYGGGGSKLKATAGEYRDLSNFLKQRHIDLIWVTDGAGWKTTKSSLAETFSNNDYVFNLELIRQGVLKEVVR